MNNERKTPRTDEIQSGIMDDIAYRKAMKLSRQLEQELEEARKEVAYLKEKFTRFNLTTEQSDELYQKWEAIRNENADLRQSLSTAERERDEARAACVVKDEAIVEAERMLRFTPPRRTSDNGKKHKAAIELCQQALQPNPGAALVERLRKAEEKLAFLKSKGLTVGLLKDGHGERLAYDIEPDSELCDLKHVHRVIDSNIERNAALSRCRELEGALRFIRDECDWKSTDAMGGGDDRIGPACTEALSSPPQAEDDSCEVCGSGKDAVADTAKRLYGCRCGRYIESFDAKQPSPEQKPQTVPREVADGLSGVLDDVMEWIDNWSPNFTDDDGWPATKNEVKRAQAHYHQAIDGRVE